MRKEAIGNARSIGGYVVYVPNDAFTSQWKAEAVKHSVGGDFSTGMTMQQILFHESVAMDRTCISSQPITVKSSFMMIVGRHLRNNTPKALAGEDCRSFLLRRSQRDMSVREILGGLQTKPKKKKRKTKFFEDEHEPDLENKKWNKDVEAAFTNEMKKNLPNDPNEDDEEQSMARQLMTENERIKQESKNAKGSVAAGKPRQKRMCGRACGHG